MHQKQIAILNILLIKALSFEQLFEVISEQHVLHREGLESILDDMLKQKLVVILNGFFCFNQWPADQCA